MLHFDIEKRHTVESIFQIKVLYLEKLKELEKLDKSLNNLSEELLGYIPYRIDYRYNVYGESREEKYVDQMCWRYFVKLFELHKYMLCTDYEKIMKELEDFKFPQFTIENANAWVNGLKSLITNNVSILIKTVFKKITEETYYTGSGYSNRKEKKRNNNGIDKTFILTTHDYSRVFGYFYDKPTITDDLEKICYILDGQSLPTETLRDKMRKGNSSTYSCKYFNLKFCKNGNTHYELSDEIRNKLNLYGPEGMTIGENIRIKIFEKN